MTLRWDYLLIAKTDILGSDVKVKVKINVDDNDPDINFGEVFVYNENLMKFNKLFGIKLDALFGGDAVPEGKMDNGLPKKIAEAADKLIEAAINIIS